MKTRSISRRQFLVALTGTAGAAALGVITGYISIRRQGTP